MEQGKGDGMGKEDVTAEETNVQQSKEEDWVEGCFKENYMVPHICPVATGGWCKSYTRCKSMAGKFIVKKVLPEYFKAVCSGKKTF